MDLLKIYKFRKWHILIVLVIILFLYVVISTTPFGHYVYKPDEYLPSTGKYYYQVPLDPESPWPKFRNNALQNGRAQVDPVVDPKLRPWSYKTGKGIFSTGVVDADDTLYIGSADHYFYAIKKDGSLKWSLKTGEVIDSSALLDDRGRVYFGSGDAYVYCLNREHGDIIWKFKADPVEAVEKKYRIKSYNVDWFEANIAMLRNGDLIAPNDNFLVYRINRDTGEKVTEYLGNELMWSLPAVNVKTDRIFFGSQFMVLKNVFCVDTKQNEILWTNGRWGSNVTAPLLTSSDKKGAIVLGGFDGYIRSFAQKSGKQLWCRGTRDHIYASPAQLSDGSILAASTDGTVYALYPGKGKIKWAFDTLEPIRSSPAVDAKDNTYFGSGDGRLYCVNPDGTLRWSYLCIDKDRNDLNSSPALGKSGVYIAGENGGIFFVPYDYPLTAAGKRDPRCTQGPGEALPSDGTFMVYTASFGGLYIDPPAEIDANQPLAFSLIVRRKGDTVKSGIDRNSLKVDVTGNPAMNVKVSANMQFFMITPEEAWTGPAGGEITVAVKGYYKTKMKRFGLKFFRGREKDIFDTSFTFKVRPRWGGALPYLIPAKAGDPSTVFAFFRLAAPNPTMLPSWNQIGFDSLHYLAGAVEIKNENILIWVIPGKLHNGSTVVNPGLEARFPLMLKYDKGLLTFYNYEGFKINFVGAWDMPFGWYRIAAGSNPVTGEITSSPVLNAVVHTSELEHYGKFLKIMGMAEIDTGHMAVFGGMNMSLHDRNFKIMPEDAGAVEFSVNESSATVKITGSKLKKKDHVYSLLLVDEKTGRPFPLYYTKKTKVETGTKGEVTKVIVSYERGEVRGDIKAYYMVDTYPAAAVKLKL